VRSMTSLTPLQPNRIIWVISIASSRRSLLLLALHIVSPISCVGLVILPRSTALRRATRTLMPSTVSSALTLMTCRLVRTKNNLKDTSGHKHSRIGSGYLQCIPASTDTDFIMVGKPTCYDRLSVSDLSRPLNLDLSYNLPKIASVFVALARKNVLLIRDHFSNTLYGAAARRLSGLLLFAPRLLPSSGVFGCLNLSGSTLFLLFRGRGILHLHLHLSCLHSRQFV
jgi:hypothetical protein